MNTDLASEKVCGSPEWAVKEKMSATVAKRSFADDELTLTGVVLKNDQDQRMFINVDTEFLKDTVLMGDLADYLIVGKKIDATLIRCSHIYYLAKLSPAPDVKNRIAGLTLARFNALKKGMTYDEVIAILGKPGELTSTAENAAHKTQMYIWKVPKSPIGANMNALFTDGKLVSKAQAGLK